MDDSRQAQVGLNEASYRRVNEGIAAGTEPAPELSILCECGRLGCNQLLKITRPEYEAVRANPRRFAILPGHDLPLVEHVVERHGGFDVVEKVEVAGAVADATDPRTPLGD